MRNTDHDTPFAAFDYARELNPQRIRLAFLNAGYVFPDVRTACELGFGQGVSLNIHAAASTTRWFGQDRSPARTDFALELSAFAGAGLRIHAESCADFAKRADLPEFDFIGIHGAWSWLSEENRAAVVGLLQRKLRVGGVLYISYNTLPGWADFTPLRELLASRDENPDAGRFLDLLLASDSRFCAAHPQLKDLLASLRQGQGISPLLRAYLHPDWRPCSFAAMARLLEEADLQYVCPAHMLDHISAFNLSREQGALLQQVADPLVRETLYDFMVNQHFRRDYWVKGARRMNRVDQREAIKSQKCVLVVPRADVPLKTRANLGEIGLNPSLYDPLLNALADYRPHSLGQLEKKLHAERINFATLYQAVMTLAGMGCVDAAVAESRRVGIAKEQSDKLNAFLCRRSRGSGDIPWLGSPVTGGGVYVPRIEQMFLEALSLGRGGPEEWAKFAWKYLSELREHLAKDGKLLENPEDNQAELRTMAHAFAQKRLPMLRTLKIV